MSLRVTALMLFGVLVASVAAASGQVPEPLRLGSDLTSEGIDDQFGFALSLSADGLTLAVGAYRNEANGVRAGHVRVFRTTGSSWSQVGADIDGDLDFTHAGTSLSLSADGSIVAINSPTGGPNSSGQVRVFGFDDGQWSQLGENINGGGVENWGRGWVSLSADGSTVAMGTLPNDAVQGGEVWVHRYDGAAWQQVGDTLTSDNEGDRLGSATLALSADGSILALGAVGGDFARVFQQVDGEWEQLGSDIEGDVALSQSSNFGYSVSLSGDGSVIAVGGPNIELDGARVGQVLVFQFEDGDWRQLGGDMRGDGVGGSFGNAVSLSEDGSLLAVGSPTNDANGANAGRVELFERVGDEWVPVGGPFEGEAEGARAGEAVALSADGSVLAIGAPSQGIGGHVQVYSLDGPVAFCAGLRATIVGTAGNDTLTGTSEADVIAGLQRNDTIRGLAGDDIICAGTGDDEVYGGRGFDVMYGAQGNDTMYFAGGSGETWRFDTAGGRAYAGAGDDVVYGSARWDRMQGGPGNDQLFGFEGRDWMRAGGGADLVDGGANIDDVHGGNGNDRIAITGDDQVRGGAGALDRCVIAEGSSPQPLISCELLSN